MSWMLLIAHDEPLFVVVSRSMIKLTGGTIEVRDASDISRAALRLGEQTRCAVWRGYLLDLGVLAGRKGKRRSGEEDDGGGELHVGRVMRCLRKRSWECR